MKNNFLKKYHYNIILLSIALINFIFILCLASKKSLWYDDIYQLYFSWDNSLIDTLKIVLKVDLNPPLWAVFTHFWVKIVPYGTLWLRLPSMLFVSMSVYMIGLAGKEAFNKKTGFVAAILFALSPFAAIECAYSFRAYGLFVFAACFLIYTYIRKIKEASVKNRILFSVAIFIIAFSHYFGAVLCVFLGIADFILALKKKLPANFFIEYVSIAFIELFWFIPQITTISNALSNFWPQTPTYKTFFGLFKYLLLDSYIFSGLFVVLVGLFVFLCVKKAKSHIKGLFFETENYCKFLFVLIPLFFVLVIFIYSNIKTESSVFVYRYFAVLIPLVLLFAAAILDEFYELYLKKIKFLRIISLVVAIILLVGVFTPMFVNKVISYTNIELESFEDAADMIMSQSEVVDGEEVLVINTTNCGRGWRYYLTHDNTRNTDNIILMDLLDYEAETDFSKYDTIYLFVVHHDYTFNPLKIRESLRETHEESVYMQKDNEWVVSNDVKIPFNATYSYVCKFEKISE